MHNRAGTVALPEDLIDDKALLEAYYEIEPDLSDPTQLVSFGTSGHRGSAFDGSFNEAHIVCITQAICDYRKEQGYDGPLFIGADTHLLSGPAQTSALEVLVANGVQVCVDSRAGFVPTPSVSLAILQTNGAPGAVRVCGAGLADGIVITPSHNPPRDGGFKYNPPNGGPADTDATSWIADRANALLRGGWRRVPRKYLSGGLLPDSVHKYDFMARYLDQLRYIVDIPAIREAGVRIGAHPLGGASVDYWGLIAEHYNIDLRVVDSTVDPTWRFMTLDWDGKIRMDCSSPYAMASLRKMMVPDSTGRTRFDIATGNDADADRHGIVTPSGLMNPNHYLAVAIQYLYSHRPDWSAELAVGKTLVSSSLIDRVVAGLGRRLVEVPVGFKWFVPGLLEGSIGFGGEESAGASFLRFDGTVWSTDKDGIILCLLASEILARTGKNPSELHQDLVAKYGESFYSRVDAPTSLEGKARLKNLSENSVSATTLAGQPITKKLVAAPGNGAAIGGLKVCTEDAWFAARPSGTENIYKIYAESFLGENHLSQVIEEARGVVSAALT